MGRRSLKGRGAFTALALVAVVTLVGTSCAKGRTATSGAGVRAYNVFVQKFRYHGLAASFKTGNLQLNFSNQESFPIVHEMIVAQLPSGKTAQDVPRLRVALRDSAEKEVQFKIIDPPKPRLPPGAVAHFKTPFDHPDDAATGVVVTFAKP